MKPIKIKDSKDNRIMKLLQKVGESVLVHYTSDKRETLEFVEIGDIEEQIDKFFNEYKLFIFDNGDWMSI